MEVSALMTRDVVTVGPEYNVADVASIMDSRRIGSVIVMEDDRVLGILTERDILKVVGQGEDPKQLPAHEALTDDLVTVAPDASLEAAANTMVNAGVRHLPVVSPEGLVGIISMRDLVRWSVQSVQEVGTEADVPHVEVSKQVLQVVHPADE